MAQKSIAQMTPSEFQSEFVSQGERGCRKYLRNRRWPNGVCCPRCGSDAVYKLGRLEFHWQCQSCEPADYRFSVLTGTPFQNAKQSLQIWFALIYLLRVKKGLVNLHEVAKWTGRPYRTCWAIWHRMLKLLPSHEFEELTGIASGARLLQCVEEEYRLLENARAHRHGKTPSRRRGGETSSPLVFHKKLRTTAKSPVPGRRVRNLSIPRSGKFGVLKYLIS